MSDSVLVALITGGISALISVITILQTSETNNKLQDERIRVMTEHITKLEQKVEQHNNFGLQLSKLEQRFDDLEKRIS